MPGSRKLTIEQRLRRFPPIVCRLLAREGRGSRPVVLSDEDIAERSGLTLAQVQGLSHLLTWDDVSCQQMLAFSKGCGVDLSDRYTVHKHWCYIKGKRAFTFLKSEPDYETRWKPMYASYVNYLRTLHHAKTNT